MAAVAVRVLPRVAMVHADETGGPGADGPQDVGDRGPRAGTQAILGSCVGLGDARVVGDVEVDQQGDDHRHGGDEYREDHVLATEEGHGACLDQPADLLDDLGAGVLG